MKLPIVFAAAVAILSTCVSAQERCEVCPGGINVDGGTETENGNTCGTIQSDAARFDTDDPICDRIKGFEELCCGNGAVQTTVANVVEATEAAAVVTDAPVPVEATETPVETTETPEADTTCSVCPNGITVDADTPTEGKNVCGGIQAAAAQFDADDGICERIKSFESTCCPEVPPTTVPAIVTTAAAVAESTAAAVEGSTVAGQSTEAAVTTAAAAAGSTVAAETTEAAVPVTTALPGSSCVVCPGGITAPSTLETVPSKTCADLLPDAARQEAGDGICELIQQSEETCCPTGGFIACSVCAGGLTVSGATLVEGDITCDDVIGDAPTIPESSDVCTTKKGYEDTCCPAIITPTTTVAATEVATTTAAAAAASTVASTSSTVSATEASTTTSTAAADVSMTNSTITEPTPAVEPKSPVGSEEESTISGFQALYDSSTGFSVSANPRYAFASIVIVGVYTMFS